MKGKNPASDLSGFLHTFRQATEAAWATIRSPESLDLYLRLDDDSFWQTGTRWTGGYSDTELSVLEQEWHLSFPPDHRQFLSVLGVPDKPVFRRFYEGQERAAAFSPSFYDWQTDHAAIRAALDWPLEGLMFDVEHNRLWLQSWGLKPDTLTECEDRLRQLIAAAPQLVPIFGHRYLICPPGWNESLVLSVYQSDIIIYGANLPSYLLEELSKVLPKRTLARYRQPVDEAVLAMAALIPFWGELIS